MRTTLFILGFGCALACSPAFGAEQEKSDKPTAKENTFIKKAAQGGMTEVELGKVAEQKGQKEEVKDFGKQMVKDHGKANDDLKDVASKMKTTVPEKLDAKHQAKIDKMSGMSGAVFDAAYIKEMVSAHEKDIAAFEKAQGEVSNEDLKKLIGETVPVMKHHLEMVKKMQAAK